jgi:putative membrane protein
MERILMDYYEKFRSFLAIFLRGLFMGSADVMPGVSGGTIALITGIYERLVHAISSIKFGFIKPLLRGDLAGARESMRDEVDFELFIPLLTGIAFAMLTLSKVILFFITNYVAYTYAFFSGLILASAYIVYQKINGLSVKNLAAGGAGLIFAYLFVGLNPIQANHTLPVIFISGFVAICAMILPGISGAFLLLLLNQYEYMLGVLNRLAIVEIVTFIAGAAIGIMSFSRVLDYLLRNHEAITMSFLVGLMIGTLRLPYNKISMVDTYSIIISAVIAITGFAIVMILESRFDYIDY